MPLYQFTYKKPRGQRLKYFKILAETRAAAHQLAPLRLEGGWHRHQCLGTLETRPDHPERKQKRTKRTHYHD